MLATDLTYETIYTFQVNKNKTLTWAVMLHKQPFIGEVYKPSKKSIPLFNKVIQGIPQKK